MGQKLLFGLKTSLEQNLDDLDPEPLPQCSFLWSEAWIWLHNISFHKARLTLTSQVWIQTGIKRLKWERGFNTHTHTHTHETVIKGCLWGILFGEVSGSKGWAAVVCCLFLFNHKVNLCFTPSFITQTSLPASLSPFAFIYILAWFGVVKPSVMTLGGWTGTDLMIDSLPRQQSASFHLCVDNLLTCTVWDTFWSSACFFTSSVHQTANWASLRPASLATDVREEPVSLQETWLIYVITVASFLQL